MTYRVRFLQRRTRLSKTIFSVTYHQSERIRPNGHLYLLNYLESLRKHSEFSFGVVVVDNESEIDLREAIKKNDFDFVEDYIRVEDQSVSGLTGAWNVGIERASQLGDLVINTNEDLTFNKSINSFVSDILLDKDRDMSIYGPMTNGVSQSAHPDQYLADGNIRDEGLVSLSTSKKADGVWEKVLNGFFLGFTSNFYHKFKTNGDLFPIQHENNRGDGKWGGQEGIMIEWFEKGATCKVVPRCWINHIKDRTYRKARYLYGDGGL